MSKPEVINRFEGKYAFLSNFYLSPIDLWNRIWSTAEHAFQGAKTHDRGERLAILTSDSPAKAKSIGRTVTLREDWDQVKVMFMAKILSEKFRQHPDLMAKLLVTSPARLVEGNNWRDEFWGIDHGRGYNVLGQLLEMIRAGIIS